MSFFGVRISVTAYAAPFGLSCKTCGLHFFLQFFYLPPPRETDSRPAVNLGLVLDRSGSMKGSKHAKAKGELLVPGVPLFLAIVKYFDFAGNFPAKVGQKSAFGRNQGFIFHSAHRCFQ